LKYSCKEANNNANTKFSQDIPTAYASALSHRGALEVLMEDESTFGSELESVQKLVHSEDKADPEEAKRVKRRELDDAIYAALLSRAHSDQARALVDTVVTMVAEREVAVGIRTNKRGKKQTALASAVERLLADLLQAQASETNKGYVFSVPQAGRFHRPSGELPRV
jgi:hypothetical protein